MATYYVGIGGNDGNSGLTWTLRKLTLNGAEDVPVVAGDTVYVGPGCYRELLTIDVSGAGGTEIVYIADVTGEHTDDVGGIVRITGTDNDQTTARANCITMTTFDYRTFRGFFMDTSSSYLVVISEADDIIFEDCIFQVGTSYMIQIDDSTDVTIRRCLFQVGSSKRHSINITTAADDAGHLFENCVFDGGSGIQNAGIGDVTTRNCLFNGSYQAYYITVALGGGQTNVINNCAFLGCYLGVQGTVAGEIVENYNTFWFNNTARQNTDVGAQSQAYPGLLVPPILHSGVSQASGFEFPWWSSELSEWSAIRAITGSNEPTEDLRGLLRPVTASKNSWGPTQFADMERETGTVHAGSVSMVLHDAGRHQIWVPVEDSSTTISVYVYREANYAGNNPQMICKQPGQADDVTTDAAAASQWNLLTTTLTPAADPPYVIVELVSRNTAAALAYETFFDDLVVS